MKKIILYTAAALLSFTIGCGNGHDANNATDKGDTAVLVKDTANTLNAKPVNDTTVPVPDSAKHH